MREMKDSGIEWIGQIPENWDLERLKFHAQLNPSTDIPEYDAEDDVSFIPMDLLKSGFHTTMLNQFRKVKSGYVCFQTGDILMAKVTPCLENGNIAVASDLKDGVGFGSTEINVIRCTNMDVQYLFYLLQCPTFIDKAKANMFGVAGLKRLAPSFLPNSYFPIPPSSEQVRIVAYIKQECAAIDTLIAAKEKTNNLLREQRQSIIYEAVTKGLDTNVPMKDSGVEWIGKIPTSWEIINLKYCLEDISSGTSVNAEDRPCNGQEYGVLKTSCITTGIFNSSENKTVLEAEYHRVSCQVKKGTVIVSRMNTPDLVGACGYVDKSYENLFLPDRLWQVQFKDDIDSKYMWYFLSSRYVRSYYASVCTGTSGSMQNISQEQFGRIKFFKPSLEEQLSTVSYLDKVCYKLDHSIELNDSSIQKLREYRQSIIYEAVTGKIEV